MRKTQTNTSDVLHFQAALAAQRFAEFETVTAAAAARRMLSWQDAPRSAAVHLADQQHDFIPPSEMMDPMRQPTRFVPGPYSRHRPQRNTNHFNLDARGLPRSPMHPVTCVRTPVVLLPQPVSVGAHNQLLPSASAPSLPVEEPPPPPPPPPPRATIVSVPAAPHALAVRPAMRPASAPAPLRPAVEWSASSETPTHASRFHVQHSASHSRPFSAATAGLAAAYKRDCAPPRPPPRPPRPMPQRPMAPSLPRKPLAIAVPRPASASKAYFVTPTRSDDEDYMHVFGDAAEADAADGDDEMMNQAYSLDDLPPPPPGLPPPPPAATAAKADAEPPATASAPDDVGVTSLAEAQMAAAVLARYALFRGWHKWNLEQLCLKLPRKELKRYEDVYREGQASNATYILLSGAIDLETEKGVSSQPPAAAAAAAPAAATSAKPGMPLAYPSRQLYDKDKGEHVGYDVAVYDDAMLTECGCILGVEGLAKLEPTARGAGATYLPRLHTATTAERSVLLVLSHTLLRSTREWRMLAREIESLGTRRRAEQCVVQMALARTPIFASQTHLKLVQLAPLFALRTCDAGDRLAEEGKQVDDFHIVMHGRVVLSQRTAWGKMRHAMGAGGSWGGSGKASELVVQYIPHDAKMPFVGESALATGRASFMPTKLGSGDGTDELSAYTVRAAEKTTLVSMPRENALQFSYDFVQFGELLTQRRQLLMQNSMHAVALQQAIEKHQDDAAHPSQELADALRLAKKANLHYRGAARVVAQQARAHHPHSPPRAMRGRVADQARKTMLQGMEVHSVATRMGLAPKDDPAGGDAAAAAAVVASSPRGGDKAGAQSTSPSRGGKPAKVNKALSRAEQLMAGGALEPTTPADEGHGGRFLDALSQLQATRRVLDEVI